MMQANVANLRKGDLVRLSPDCFTKKNGGTRDYPLTNLLNDERGIVDGTLIATEDDHKAWRKHMHESISEAQASGDNTFNIAFDDAGEARLPPTSYTALIHRDRVYTLIRARCRPDWNYRKHPGMALVLCTVTGEEIYIKRNLLEKIF